MDSNPFEEVKSKSDSTSFLSMTVCADVKALTEHMVFLMLQIASSRKTVRRRGGFFFFSSQQWQKTLECCSSPAVDQSWNRKETVPFSSAMLLISL